MQEIHHALRRLLKSPLHLAAGLLAFALGIGVNTAVYSLAQAILFRPVELAHLDQLVVLESYSRGVSRGIASVSPADFEDLERSSKAFSAIGFAQEWPITLTRDLEPEEAFGAKVSTNWLDLLGMAMLEGRSFRPGEEEAGRHRVAVIAEGLWRRRYGADPKILGRRIQINQVEHEVIGVSRQTSRFPAQAQIYVPMPRNAEFSAGRATFELIVAGKLETGVSRAEAQGEIDSIAARLARQYRESHEARSLQIAPLRERVTSSDDTGKHFIIMLMLATSFALLIACANVANLQLARVSARAREFAILGALGAGRWRIARQVLVESLILSAGGALLGVLASTWSLDLIKQMLPAENAQYVPMWATMRVDRAALLYSSLLALLAGVIAGVVPAWVSMRPDPQAALREGGRSASGSASRHWHRAVLVSSQIGLALVLLIGAGLMIRSAQASLGRFDAKRPGEVATMRIRLPELRYETVPQRIEFQRRLASRIGAIAGVSATGLVNFVPLSNGYSGTPYVIQGEAEPTVANRPYALDLATSPDYFVLMQVRLVQGRLLDSRDTEQSTPVCLIDQTLVDRSFAGRNPLGQKVVRIRGSRREVCEVVGVVSAELNEAWAKSPSSTIYRPLDQAAPDEFSVMLRTSQPMEAALRDMKAILQQLDPDLPANQLWSYQQLIANTLAGLKIVASLMGMIGAVALLLACLGIYSVMSFVVMERTGEIGMRVAMGAAPSDILWLLGSQGLRIFGAGLVFGLAAGFGLAQLASGLLFGVTASDFWNLSTVTLLLAVVSALAMYLPARRAMAMDPADALRHD